MNIELNGNNNEVSFFGEPPNIQHLKISKGTHLRLSKGTKVSIKGREYILDTPIKIEVDD